MTPRKTNPNSPNPVLTWRVPDELGSQLDDLCKLYGMNRVQVINMLITREYGWKCFAPPVERVSSEEIPAPELVEAARIALRWFERVEVERPELYWAIKRETGMMFPESELRAALKEG